MILTENPPNHNPSYDNFDTSGFPQGNCTPITIAPTVTISMGGPPITLVDSTHVLDTNGIDTESCSTQHNESIQWRQIGTVGVKTATLTLSPATTTLAVGQPVTETATLLDGGGNGLPDATVNFAVTSGPNAGQSGSAVTDTTGKATFTYTDTAPGTDIIVASVPTAYTVGPMQSNQTSILWTNDLTQVWSGADIGNPLLAGSDSLSNGLWTISGSGTDIGGTADQFHFVWQSLASDGGISAQVLTQTNDIVPKSLGDECAFFLALLRFTNSLPFVSTHVTASQAELKSERKMASQRSTRLDNIQQCQIVNPLERPKHGIPNRLEMAQLGIQLPHLSNKILFYKFPLFP